MSNYANLLVLSSSGRKSPWSYGQKGLTKKFQEVWSYEKEIDHGRISRYQRAGGAPDRRVRQAQGEDVEHQVMLGVAREARGVRLLSLAPAPSGDARHPTDF